MSIKETQRSLIQQKVVQEQLRKGEYPSISFIDKTIEEQFGGKITGTPRFTHRLISKGATSDAAGYNAMLAEIEDDLGVGFEEVRSLNNQIMALSSYYDSTRVRVEQDLRAVELKAAILATRTQSHINRDAVGDNINDFSRVEFTANLRRNIPRTDALIDLRHSEVGLDKVKNATTKHDLSAAIVTVRTLTKSAKITHLSPATNSLQDNVEDAWRSVVTSSEELGAVLQMDVELTAAAKMTSVAIDSQSGKPATITLYLSGDGETFTEFETRRVLSKYQWVFDRRDVLAIRFRLEKNEEDQLNGTDREYMFGAKTIEAKDDLYTKQAYFVSKPYAINSHDAIDYIHLSADDYQPPGTHIRYYVGLDYDTNLIEWQEIQSDRPIEMKMVQTRNLEIDPYADGYNVLKYQNFGQSFYGIQQLPQKPLAGTTQLLMGRNMWTKETIAAPFTDNEEGSPYETSMKDWIRVASPRKMYMNIDNYTDVLEKDTFQRYVTYVYIADLSVQHGSEGSITVGEHASHALYVNNNRVKSVNGGYQLSFKQGWNKIEILTYSRQLGQEILFNLYLREVSDQVYANHETLQEVSLYDLLNNTSSRTYNRFAVDESNTIIVNYNPKELDIQRNGVEYSLSYRYSVSDKDKHQIRFMAILSKEDDDVTMSPRLKGYQLIIE